MFGRTGLTLSQHQATWAQDLMSPAWSDVACAKHTTDLTIVAGGGRLPCVMRLQSVPATVPCVSACPWASWAWGRARTWHVFTAVQWRHMVTAQLVDVAAVASL